jgi:hypothetical protein
MMNGNERKENMVKERSLREEEDAKKEKKEA